MVTYGLRLDNITVATTSHITIASYNMTTPSQQISDAVSAAAGILISATPVFVVPVDTATVSASTDSALLPGQHRESSISEAFDTATIPASTDDALLPGQHRESSTSQASSYSLPDPNVLVLTTFLTTTVPYTNIHPVIQVPSTSSAQTSTVPIVNPGPQPTRTFIPSDLPTVSVASSSTINIHPPSTITPIISSITPPLLNSTSTNSILTPSYIIPTTLATPSPTTTDPASLTSTVPRPTTSSHSSSTSIGVYIGAAIGGFLVLVLLIFALVCLLRRRNRKLPKHHPDRPAFIGGYELKLDKVGDLQRVVHEKIVRRNTFEAWKKGVVPDIDPENVAGKSEINVSGGSPRSGYLNSLEQVGEDIGLSDLNEEGDEEVGDDHDEYVVSPIEEEQTRKSRRPVSGITPLISEWEQRGKQNRGSANDMIGLAL